MTSGLRRLLTFQQSQSVQAPNTWGFGFQRAYISWSLGPETSTIGYFLFLFLGGGLFPALGTWTLWEPYGSSCRVGRRRSRLPAEDEPEGSFRDSLSYLLVQWPGTRGIPDSMVCKILIFIYYTLYTTCCILYIYIYMYTLYFLYTCL